MEIDGKDLAGKNNQEVSEMLRGQVGTSFKLKVQRPGTEKPLDFDIVRRSIQLPFIPYYTVLDNNIVYQSQHLLGESFQGVQAGFSGLEEAGDDFVGD